MALGFVAAAFPDSDFILRGIDVLTYLNLHRGVTHSIVMLPLWALILALVVRALNRNKKPWRVYFGVIAMGIGIHIAGDVITAYGTKIFAPFSDFRLSWPTTFIIDPIFTGIIVLGLLLSQVRSMGRPMAVAGLSVLVLYVGFQATQHYRSMGLAQDYIATHGLAGARAYAMPQPLSPFHWKAMVIDGDNYHEARVNLARSTLLDFPVGTSGFFKKLKASYLPVKQIQWIRHTRFGKNPEDIILAQSAWDHPAFLPFRRFAMFPSLYKLERGPQRVCAWFSDLRFTLVGRVTPFRYGMCRGVSSASWQLESMSRP